MHQIRCFIAASLYASLCYCQRAHLEVTHEDTAIIQNDQVKPFLVKSVDSKMKCYMKCLGDQDRCCVIEMKQKADKDI